MLVAAKADDVCILDVSSQCSFTEHMVLATGRSHRHIQAAAAAVAYQVSLDKLPLMYHCCTCAVHCLLGLLSQWYAPLCLYDWQGL